MTVLAAPLTALAEVTQSDLVLVTADDVVPEDLYAAGNRVLIEGRVEGDLYAAAFEEVAVAGEVTGDVVAISSRVSITGQVGGSVRVVAGTVSVGGEVTNDLLVAAWNTGLLAGGSIGRDLINWGRNASVAGEVGGDILGRFSRLQLDGRVGGSVEVSVVRLVVEENTRVEGDLAYRSRAEAEINAVDPASSVIRQTPLRPNIRVRALILLTLGLTMLTLMAGGLILATLWPDLLESSIATAGRGLHTWLAGLGVAVSPLIGAALLGLLLTLIPTRAGIPLVVILLPVAVGLAGLVLLGSLLGVIPVAGAVGRRVVRRRSAAAAVVVGIVVVFGLLVVPWVRWAALLVIVPLGLGSWLPVRSENRE
jgi:cytoskeletal protein CcmA (bactofilin family)